MPRLIPWMVVALLAGCAVADPAAPPAIRYGESVCVRCGMLIAEARFAAGAVRPDGATRVYDDIGCFLEDARAGALAGWRLWVHDYATGAWIPAAAAVYLQAVRLETPMGYGIAAFASVEGATAVRGMFDGRLAEFEDVPLMRLQGGATP